MRVLGDRASIDAFRFDLVYLEASLLADDRPEVSAIAARVRARISQLRAERDLFETAEDAAVVVTARKGRRDTALDRLVVTFGGHVRAVSPTLYSVFFRAITPTAIARAALQTEVLHVQRIIGELDALPADHAQRSYAPAFRTSLEALVLADQASQEADVSLALARSRLQQFKLATDRLRVEIFGELQTLLGSKEEADSFFRRSSSAPSADDDGGDPPPAG